MQRRFHYQRDGATVTVDVASTADGYSVRIGERTVYVDARPGDRGRIDLTIGNRRVRAYVAADGDRRHVAVDGNGWTLVKTDPRRKRRQGRSDQSEGALTAAMPSLVLDVPVHVGATVARGDVLVLLEAMKMEVRITAPRAGVVRRIGCQAGEAVQQGQLLIELENGQSS